MSIALSFEVQIVVAYSKSLEKADTYCPSKISDYDIQGSVKSIGAIEEISLFEESYAPLLWHFNLRALM